MIMSVIKELQIETEWWTVPENKPKKRKLQKSQGKTHTKEEAYKSDKKHLKKNSCKMKTSYSYQLPGKSTKIISLSVICKLIKLI